MGPGRGLPSVGPPLVISAPASAPPPVPIMPSTATSSGTHNGVVPTVRTVEPPVSQGVRRAATTMSEPTRMAALGPLAARR